MMRSLSFHLGMWIVPLMLAVGILLARTMASPGWRSMGLGVSLLGLFGFAWLLRARAIHRAGFHAGETPKDRQSVPTAGSLEAT